MKDIWIISDTHFNHQNILKFTDNNGNKIRNFDSLSEMNEFMISNWNSKVKPGDKVYHLGDVFFGSKDDFKKLWPRLNGQKRLIVGNHDDIKYLSSGAFFKKVDFWRVFKDHGILLSHVPLDPSQLRHCLINVHGHIHQNSSPTEYHRCVCVEHTNYSPIHIEDLRVKN